MLLTAIRLTVNLLITRPRPPRGWCQTEAWLTTGRVGGKHLERQGLMITNYYFPPMMGYLQQTTGYFAQAGPYIDLRHHLVAL